MDEELLVPFSFCGGCQKEVPLLMKEFNFDEEEIIDVAVCPLCYDILNMEGDIEVNYYDPEQIERLGYQVVKEEEGRRD